MLTIDPLFSTPAMSEIFSPASHVQAMLDFEAALARAEARIGIIPAAAGEAIAAVCRVERFDVPALYQAAVSTGTVAIPLVKALTEHAGSDAGRYVHWGATSQDAIDTALMLQAARGLALLEHDLLVMAGSCAALAELHRATLMAGRTLLQHALPITFGLKAARWLALTCRQVARPRALRTRSLVVQFGGAAGTLASLGPVGLQVVELVAGELKLGLPDLPWHAERDRVAELAAGVGIVAGAMAKVAGDLALMSQTELGEAAEASGPGKGGSSTLPHKRNPVDVTFARAAAQLALGQVPVVLAAMAHEHERAAGSWQAEWAALPSLFCYTAGAVARVRDALAGLEVDADRMRANLDLTQGLLMAESLATALALHIGKPSAQLIVQVACEQAQANTSPLLEIALATPELTAHLTATEIERALDPLAYLGSTDAFIDRALDGYRQMLAEVEQR